MMVLCVHFLPRIRCENVFYVPMKIPDYIAIFWQQVVIRKFCDKQELHKAVIRLWIEYHFLFFTVKKIFGLILKILHYTQNSRDIQLKIIILL